MEIPSARRKGRTDTNWKESGGKTWASSMSRTTFFSWVRKYHTQHTEPKLADNLAFETSKNVPDNHWAHTNKREEETEVPN